jgi:hypothetical protein
MSRAPDALYCHRQAVQALRKHVRAIQAEKARRASSDGHPRSPGPVIDCINALPEIIKMLDAAEFEVEVAFERYEDAAAA